MEPTLWTFPQYRKLLNDRSYYRIDSEKKMKEIQVIGSRWMWHEMEAKILPERLLIQDLLSNEGSRWVIISEEEYDSFVRHCEANLKEKLSKQ